jgi:protoheme ferro-lyase
VRPPHYQVRTNQFLADHLEILFDLDVGRAQAEAAQLRFTRIESLNTSPRFIDALATPGVDSTAAVPSAPIRFQPRGRRSREV